MDEMKSQLESFVNYMDEALEDVKIDEELDNVHITGPYNSTGVRRGTMPKFDKEEVKESSKILPRHHTILKGPPDRR